MGDKMTFLDVDFPELMNDIAQREDNELYKKINNASKWVYGCEVRDNALLHDTNNFLRYGHLARKAFMHYAGDNYNPHKISMMNEIFIRYLIKSIVEEKVAKRIKGYDWECLDNLFAKTIGDLLGLNIPYDQARLDQGIREDLKTPLFYVDEGNA